MKGFQQFYPSVPIADILIEVQTNDRCAAAAKCKATPCVTVFHAAYVFNTACDCDRDFYIPSCTKIHSLTEFTGEFVIPDAASKHFFDHWKKRNYHNNTVALVKGKKHTFFF